MATVKRFGGNLIFAISNQGYLNFMVNQERFTATVFLEFYRRLPRNPVHHSLDVKNWVKENEGRLGLAFLSSPTPEISSD
jgi:hypothetical protein